MEGDEEIAFVVARELAARVEGEAEGGRVVIDTVAAQGDNQVIRNAEAEIQVP